MSAYRFCRTDDVGLLVEALNRCRAPYFPDEPPATPTVFKRSIRDLQVWCSSCMVAFSGPDPIGVLIGAKRTSGTLVHTIAVHPDHRRQGHGRHLLTSLGSKLAILGPPRIVAEVPETLAPASALFTASAFVEESLLVDYVLRLDEEDEAPASPRARSGSVKRSGTLEEDRFLIPVTVDDLVANGLLEEGGPQLCWERSVETLMARKGEISGLAVASGERIEAYLLYVTSGAPEGTTEILSLRSAVDDGGTCLRQLLSRLGEGGMNTLTFAKVHSGEMSKECLEALGFRPAAVHRLYAGRAHAN